MALCYPDFCCFVCCHISAFGPCVFEITFCRVFRESAPGAFLAFVRLVLIVAIRPAESIIPEISDRVGFSERPCDRCQIDRDMVSSATTFVACDIR